MLWGGVVLAALLLVAAFPPMGWWWLTWLAPGGLYLALATTQPKPGALRAFCFGGVLYLAGAHWMGTLALPLWLAMLLYPSCLWAVYGAAQAAVLLRLPRWAQPVGFALGWAAFEWGRSLGVYAFPWFSLASAHARPSALPLLQSVAILGPEGLAFCCALTAALLAEGLRQHRARYAAVLVLPLVLCGTGRLVPAAPEPPLRVAIIQAGIVGRNAGQYYTKLTRIAAQRHPEVIIWPEGAAAPLGEEGVAALARDVHTPLLVGHYGDEPTTHRPTNLALLVAADGTLLGRYQKQRLAPFGEVYPLQTWLPGVYRAFGVTWESFLPGEKPGLLTLPAGPTLGLAICFESAFPWVVERTRRDGAQALVVLTSDQTFQGTVEQQQHLDQAVVRAVQTRLPVLRAATTGISAVIHSDGRIEQTIGSGHQGILYATLR